LCIPELQSFYCSFLIFLLAQCQIDSFRHSLSVGIQQQSYLISYLSWYQLQIRVLLLIVPLPVYNFTIETMLFKSSCCDLGPSWPWSHKYIWQQSWRSSPLPSIGGCLPIGFNFVSNCFGCMNSVAICYLLFSFSSYSWSLQ
jgi:hypothetical protein